MASRLNSMKQILLVVAAILVTTLVLTPAVLAESPMARTGNVRTIAFGAVRGVVFQDWDQDNVRDEGEPGLAEALITLYNAQGKALANRVTRWDGAFSFSNLLPGKYTLVETAPLGYSAVKSLRVEVTVRSGATTEVNFANVLLLGPVPRP